MAEVPAQTVKSGLPADYKPEEGLKRVAVAEAAEKYYARAKDADKLFEALEAKLTEQRNFIIWWDLELHDGVAKAGRPTTEKSLNLTDLLDYPAPDEMTRKRWRQRLTDLRKFADALEAAHVRCVRIAEFQKGATEQKGASGSGENEWFTPPRYVAIARDVLGGIDLDPASSEAGQKFVEAAEYFSRQDDGLAQEWHGRVWLNPPYAQPLIAEFVSKLCREWRAGRVDAAIMLTHNYTDNAWFHEAAAHAKAICFTRGRVKFVNEKGEEAAPTQGQAFFYFGGEAHEFAERFREIGFVVTGL